MPTEKMYRDLLQRVEALERLMGAEPVDSQVELFRADYKEVSSRVTGGRWPGGLQPEIAAGMIAAGWTKKDE